MKLRLLVLGSAALLASALSSVAGVKAASKPEVVWAARLCPAQFQSGVAGDLLKALGLLPLPGKAFEGTDPASLESLEVTAYHGFGGDEEMQFFVDLHLAPGKNSADALLDALQQKYGGTPEEISGRPATRFTVPLPPEANRKAQDFWLAKPAADRLIISPHRAVMEAALQRDPSAAGPVGARRENELAGGVLELDRLAKDSHDSDLLALVRHLEFHIDGAGDALHLAVAAALEDGRAARRVARMLEGMITAMSLDDPSSNGPSLDDRLKITATDAALEVEVTLDAKESRELLDAFTGELRDRKEGAQKRNR